MGMARLSYPHQSRSPPDVVDGEKKPWPPMGSRKTAEPGIRNPIREAVTFSPPILFQQRSSMKSDTTETSGMARRSPGHRWDAKRRPDDRRER
ncbi:hypothetical protein ACLB2K_061511 [Fragaria x ananassa]